MTAAKSLPGENQSFADLSLRFVARRLMPAALFSWMLELVADPVGGVRAGEGAGDAKHESEGGCSGEIDVESVQCVTNWCCGCGCATSDLTWLPEDWPRKDDGEGERDRRVNARRTGLRSRDLREGDRERESDRPCEWFGVDVDAGGETRNDEPSVAPKL
jgi:hypothetical protein